MTNRIFVFLLYIFFYISLLAQNGERISISKQNDPKMNWWKDAKFGMFIHWGIYAVPAGKWGENTNYGEWIMKSAKIPIVDYSALAKQFNPTKFNADEWVKVAKDAGQKYIVITAKHHDGFAMFASKASKFNIVDATPFKRDILKELANACRKQGMKLGFYYSQAQDWYHKGGAVWGGQEWDETHRGNMSNYIDSIVVPQVKEILENYGDVAVLWWDTPTNMTKEMSQKLSDIVKKYPNLITNNRLGAGMGGDLETPEQYIPATGYPGRNWEVCMTMNGNWGYNAYDERWKSTSELIRKLIEIVSKGGNFLLNVGPTAEGNIPEVCQQNLREIGDWLHLNGEAIYGTQASPFPFLSWGLATRKDQRIYLHIFSWPKNGKVTVPFTNKITKAYLLADAGRTLKVKLGKENSVIQLPHYAPDKISSIVVIQFEGEPRVLPIPSLGKKMTASSTETTDMIQNLTDGDPKSQWSASKSDKSATLDIDLVSSSSIQCLSLAEPWHPWTGIKQEYELQYLNNSEWKKVISGVTDGSGITVLFEPINAIKFRLILKNEKEAPKLNEMILFRAE